jgi:drug/metabolite transporter (DMT)-like permease
MKFNFWQWLGIAIIILGIVGVTLYKMQHSTPNTSAPSSQRP